MIWTDIQNCIKKLIMFLTRPLSNNLAGVAKMICEECNWNISNLELQKIIYLTHMMYAGRTGQKLVDEDFQAWMYGPVIPELYEKMNIYGASPVRDRFYNAQIQKVGAENVIREACAILKNYTGGQLVSNTHMKGGAWDNHYQAGVRDIVIPFDSIKQEYKNRG